MQGLLTRNVTVICSTQSNPELVCTFTLQQGYIDSDATMSKFCKPYVESTQGKSPVGTL
jgi:hypothetical protein